MTRKRNTHDTNLLMSAARRGDLWMIKTVYLSFLLARLGVDVQFIWQIDDKEAIYEAIERARPDQSTLP